MENQMEIIGYEIRDNREGGRVVGRYGPAGKTKARRRADRMDNEYGAYRYTVHPVWAPRHV